MLKLTREEQALIDDNSTRQVNRIVQAETPLAYLVYRIAAADIEQWTPEQWQRLLNELENDKRKLVDWVDAQLAAEQQGEDMETGAYHGDRDLGYQY